VYKYFDRLSRLLYFLSVNLAFLLLLFFSQCHSKKKENQSNNSSLATNTFTSEELETLSDRKLAIAVCGSCHMFPEPTLLDKASWKNGVLPKMALRLGFITLKNNPYEFLSTKEIQQVTNSAIFPGRPVIDSALWSRVVNYYVANAPETPLQQDKKEAVDKNWKDFIPVAKQLATGKKPTVTLVEYDSLTKVWYIGNRDSKLYRLNSLFHVTDSMQLESPPADIGHGTEHEPYVLTMGEMDPNDQLAGKLEKVQWPLTSSPKKPLTSIIDNLQRPVHISTADLNGDKLTDKIICGFGHYTGKLAWYKQLSNGKHQEYILKATAGARKTFVTDINHDQQPDIIALMAQGNEGIYAFINKGQNTFEEKILLRFPPVYGSSDFELADFNQDGFIDILYTNGDNADYSYSLKKYHGVRIFMNDGKNNFYQHWFYPLHGATKAVTRDFDQDGDLDIGAISFFPDYEKAPEESFVYFENAGKLGFNPYTFENAKMGRWLTMDVGDVDDDSDLDIVLGSFIFSTTPVPDFYRQLWNEKGTEVLLLINQKVSSAILVPQ
jgi:hypothetical protein